MTVYPMIKLQNISKTYPSSSGVFYALRDLSLEIGYGQYIAVTGPSGAGKSTLLNILGGMTRPDHGDVLVNGKQLYHLSEKERNEYRRVKIGFVFQQFHLIPYLTVYENILTGTSGDNNQSNIQLLLERFQLENKSKHHPSQLSVGEKQRVALIRATVSRPDMILADEPTGNLDQENSKIILDFFREYHGEGKTVILVTHTPGLSELAEKVISLRNGIATFS